MGTWSRIDNRRGRVSSRSSSHPEEKEGEVFLRNAVRGEMKSIRAKWHSARMGKAAYGDDGTRIMVNGPAIRQLHPVFVKKAEMESTDQEAPAYKSRWPKPEPGMRNP